MGFLLFGDGACSGNPGPGGWGTLIASETEVWELGGGLSRTTNNQMELTALIEGLRSLKASEEPIKILLDSVYVLRGARDWIWGWKKKGWKTAEGKDVANADLWNELIPILANFQKKQLEWCYVPGHEGVPGNERVDAIAVAFSKGLPISLYRGKRSSYPYHIEQLPEDLSIPELKYGSGEKKVAHSYLSVVNGVAERHLTWKECEARVKGRSGARFKKAMSADDETKILAEWGAKLK